MRTLVERLRDSSPDDCQCTTTFEGDRLVVNAAECPGEGRLSTSPDCREAVVDRLRERDVATVSTRRDGMERVYEEAAAALLVAAGRFADAVADRDESLGERACRDPLGAARAATGRASPVADIVAETGLAEIAANVDGYENALAPFVGPEISRARVGVAPPTDAGFERRRELATDAVVREYDRPDRESTCYHLEPVEQRLDPAATATLSRAAERLASGAVSGGDRAPRRAVQQVADEDDPVETLVAVLRKHTRGHGVIEDLFADERVSDVFVTAPAESNRLRVRIDGEVVETNVRLPAEGVEALASRFRRESGRAFSRASPTLDATTTVGDRQVRVAGVTDPVSEGTAFAFRAHEREAWTLPGLVANGTLSPAAAGLLSLSVERDAATLLAGTRGAGKTTLLGALLFEIPGETRTVVIEDTPELPVGALQSAGRDVQALRTDDEGAGVDPSEALRTALRLGEGALVLGEVRGEEASVLYEAMRVGASGSAVLGTIHGDGGRAVRERVVADLGVAESSFAATDLVVTCEPYESPAGRARRVKAIEEVRRSADGVVFDPLFELDDGTLAPTGRIARGNSHLLERLRRSGESYAAVRDHLDERADWLAGLADRDVTDAEAVVAAHAHRREDRA